MNAKDILAYAIVILFLLGLIVAIIVTPAFHPVIAFVFLVVSAACSLLWAIDRIVK